MLLRGHHVNPWDLRPWERLTDRYEVTVVRTASNEFDSAGLRLPHIGARTVRDRLPPGRVGRALAYAAGDRYVELDPLLRGADIVHASEIHTWFSAQAAALRARLDFKLVLTVWETIPFLEGLRWPRERRNRRTVLPAADLVLPATERARRALLLEGVEPERMRVCQPGIDTDRFTASGPGRSARTGTPREHLVLSPGRLVWEKGHQDALRAVAALRRGLLGPAPPVRLLIVGSGPEEKRLRRHAADLGIADRVELRPSVPYDEMPALYRSASAMVLASLPRRGWEEQFGMVLAEALASGTAIVAARSGAIPEVLSEAGELFDPGDWHQLAAALLDGPLATPPATRVAHDPDLVARYSLGAAAERIAAAYSEVLAGAPILSRQ